MSVRHALLAMLSEGPAYGLRLQQEFEARTGEVWPLNVGQVYTTLQRLERDGLVESDANADDGPQNSFTLTDSGRQALVEWLTTPPDTDVPPRDELVIKIMVAVGVPGIDVREVIQAHRRQMVEAMQTFTRLKVDLDTDEVGAALIIDAELFRLEGVVRWLDSAEVRLSGRTSSPAVEVPAEPINQEVS